MTNFCRGWIPNYAAKTYLLQQRIYDKPMAAQDKYAAMFWLQAVVLASLALQSSASIVFCWQPILKVPHAASALLLRRKMSCMAVLLSQANLTITRRVTLNPATLPAAAEDREPHDVSQSQPGLNYQTDTIGKEWFVWLWLFVDGSSRMNPNGTRCAGYAAATLTETLEGEQLPKHYSAQAAELIVQTEVCKLSCGKRVTIYTNSTSCLFCCPCVRCSVKNKAMVASTGKPIPHQDKVLRLSNVIALPQKWAICHTRKRNWRLSTDVKNKKREA